MSSYSYKTVPIYWNNVDGRLETFYKSYDSSISSYVLTSISSFKIIDYIIKKDNGELEYLGGGKYGDYLEYVKDNVVYDLSKSVPNNVSEIWELVGFIMPFMYENITINEPMRRIINIGEYHTILLEKTSQAKFYYFKELSNSKSEKNISKQICQLPDEIIDKIGNYCGVDN